MYLIDTNVISEYRKGRKANPGVRRFFTDANNRDWDLYLSAVTVGELRRGVELIKHRGDSDQAAHLETWLATILIDYAEKILPFAETEAEIWGVLRVPHPESALDKQIAATALVNDLIIVTRNDKDFAKTGAKLLNPFE